MSTRKMFNIFVCLGFIISIGSMILSIFTVNKGFFILNLLLIISLVVTIIIRKPHSNTLPDFMVVTIMLEIINFISIPLMLSKLY